jgi:DNA-binding NarL/FixJ family response regulator/predicted TIM-barrel fold metal-dependent hydrolase
MSIAVRWQTQGVQYYQYSGPADVLLADNQKIVRDGIKAILARAHEFRVVGEAESASHSLLLVKRLHPHIVLLSLSPSAAGDVEFIAEIRGLQPDCKIAVLSGHDGENLVLATVRAGARAYILHNASDTDLLEALRIVAASGMYMSPQVSDGLLLRIRRGDLETHAPPTAAGSLSPRERQVMRMVAGGKTSKEIAATLDLREQTVRSYRKTMMRKLHVNNVAGLTQVALYEGLTGATPMRSSPEPSTRGAPLRRDSPWGPLAVADAHIHFLSHRFFASLVAQRPGLSWQEAAQRLGWLLPPEEPEALAAAWIEELDRQQIGACAIVSGASGDVESVVRAARMHPGRLIPFAVVDPRAFDPAAFAEVRAACLFPAMHLFSMHDKIVHPVFEWAARHKRAVFVHCGAPGIDVHGKLGLASEFDLRYSSPIDVHAVALRYPAVPVIVPHLGAGYFREALMLADLCPNVHLDTSSLQQWVRYQAAPLDLCGVFRRALAVVGATRLLLGTGSAFFPRGWNASAFEDQARALDELGVSASDAANIFGNNLLRMVRG